MKDRSVRPEFSIFESPDAVAHSIAQQLFALSNGETKANISLSGGSTPKHVFGYIAHSDFATQINWQQLHFWWGDERCVPATHEQSNYGEAMRLLFSHVLIPAENLHPIHGELSPEKACIEFKDEMAACLPSISEQGVSRPVYDWIILGVGEDGHTASLFPESTDFDNTQNAELAYHPESGQERISLTAPVICSAKRITYLALGGGKAPIVADILNRHPLAEKLPAARIKANQGQTEWYLDEQSADQLSAK